MKDENKIATENKIISKKNNNIILLLIIICILIILLIIKLNFKSNKIINNSNQNTNVSEATKDKKNNEFETEENITEKEIKILSKKFIDVLNPMNNICLNNKIDKDCFSADEISNLTFLFLDEDQKFENKEDINEVEYNDYVSYDTFKQYVKRTFDIENYIVPNDFSNLTKGSMACHKYTNTGKNIKRYTNVPGCSFGTHEVVTIDNWYYNYESYKEEGNNIIITVVASYKYNENRYENNETIIYTDERKEERVDNEYDSKLKRLNYTFKKGDNYLTLLSIELKNNE